MIFGKAGKNLVWSLYDEGTLFVLPKDKELPGYLEPVTEESTPWKDVPTMLVKTVIFKDGCIAPKNCSNLFNEFIFLEKADLKGLDLSTVEDMSSMFEGCLHLSEVVFKSQNTGNLKNLKSLFFRAISLKSFDFNVFNTKNVTDMSLMFFGCDALETVNFSSANTENLQYMNGMFGCCPNLKEINLSGICTRNLKEAERVFDCATFEKLDLSGFNVQESVPIEYFLATCGKKGEVVFNPNRDDAVTKRYSMRY